MTIEKVGVLASGRGSNFQAILEHVELDVLNNVEVKVLISDNPDARALKVADRHGIQHQVVRPEKGGARKEYEREIYQIFEDHQVSLVALAGFMRIVSPYLIRKYRGRIMNIHPALLPSFKGLNAQKQALDRGVKISGCTVHYAAEEVDAGPIILQKALSVKENDTEETLSDRILIFEHRLYSKAIQLHADKRIEITDNKTKIDYSGNWEGEWNERQEAFIKHQRGAWKGSEIYEEIFE